MHQAVRKYLRFVVNKQVYEFTCLPFGLATSPREFTKLLRPVVALLRRQGVKLHIYLNDWLIRADTPEQAKLHAQTTIRVLQFLDWIINYEKSDLTPSQDFQFIGMQFNTRQFTVAPLPKMRLKIQTVHQHWMTNLNITARDLHRLLGMLVFMALLVQLRRLRLRPVQWWAATTWCQRTRSWSDRITVPQWVLSEVPWWASPAVLQGLPLAAKETEVTLFTDASSSELGSPVTLTLDTGTVVSISKILAHQRSGDAGHHQRCERLPASSEVPCGSLDVRQHSDCDLHQERGGHTIVHTNGDDHTTAQVVWSQGDYIGSRPSARSAQHPGWVDRCHVHALGQRGGASCMRSRHSRWSLKFCRRSLSHQSLQRQTSPIDDNITSHICGFCATSLGVWSSSQPAHLATHQSFPAGTSGAMQNHAQVGPSSCAFIITETAIHIRRWCWRGIHG